MKYEYLLQTWGGFYNREHQAKHGLEEGFYWFDSKEARNAFIAERRRIEKALDATVLCFSEGEGYNTRTRYTAHMDFIKDGVRHSISMPFGYTVLPETIEYMFHQGNYSCDCNRSLFIARHLGNDPEFEELVCGDAILLENFRLEAVQGSDASFERPVDGD